MKRTQKLDLLIVVLGILIVMAVTACVFLMGKQDYNKGFQNKESQTTEESQTESDEHDLENDEKDSSTEEKLEDVLTEGFTKKEEVFAIFGVDSRSNQLGKGTRSDSIMLVYVNHEDGVAKVASIYRDCMVYIDGKGYEKITHAHFYGGPEMALSTINDNFDLKAENYVTVNFNSLTTLVDMLGGVEIEISDVEAAVMRSENIGSAGTYLLNGAEALTFSRIRKIDTDYKRTERQREVLFQIFEKSKALTNLEKLELLETMLSNINTSYDGEEILKLLYALSQYEITQMTAFPQVFYGGTVEGAWVEVPCTLVDMNASLHEFLYGEAGYTPSEHVLMYSEVLSQKVAGPNHDMREKSN